MSNLAVLPTKEVHQDEHVIALLERALAKAKAGEFSEVFVVGHYRAEVDGYKTFFAHSPLFNRTEVLGYLDMFKHQLLSQLLSE